MYRLKINKQIKEDFNFAKKLSAIRLEEEPPKEESKPVNNVKCEAACSSKTADFIDSLMLQGETKSNTSYEDDLRIAELLQAEFDREYDEEIKRIENSRNKSKFNVLD